MEFLDPEEKRARTFRLFMAYGLIIFVIVVGTFILSFALQGVDLFSRQTEIRNGLLFVESKPVSAQININGDTSKRTGARFVLPEGNYNVKLTESGYRPWQKDVVVQGGKVVYHVYPKLIPTDITSSAGYVFGATPQLYTQSPDKRFIVTNSSDGPSQFITLDTDSPTATPLPWALPTGLWNTQEASTQRLEPVEWSTDNKHLLIAKIAQNGTKQYLMVNREKPEESINLTTQLKLNQSDKVKLRDKKYDQFYVLDTATKTLRKATITEGLDQTVVAQNVIAFSPYANDTVLYATDQGAELNQYAVRLLHGNNTYALQPIVRSDTILLDIARFQNDWYIVAGSTPQELTTVYINPFDGNNQPISADASLPVEPIKPQLLIPLAGARFASFSENARFIGLQSAEAFSVYDAELKQVYSYKSPVLLPSTGAIWMDGHRYSVVTGGNEVIFEYDGQNMQTLAPAIDNTVAYFDKDYNNLFTLVSGADDKTFQQINSLVYKPTN